MPSAVAALIQSLTHFRPLKHLGIGLGFLNPRIQL